ncbi:arylsulfatase, partial [Klebsiella pneumoniae subsp. pneumoniae]
SAEFTIGEGELMAHDVPLGCAPDEYDDLISGTYSHLPKRTMVTKAQGKMIDYVGIDSKTGRYLAVDPATMKPVPAPQAIPVSEIH